jgi:hypothetical protein
MKSPFILKRANNSEEEKRENHFDSINALANYCLNKYEIYMQCDILGDACDLIYKV